jgi:hypothetical protein
VEDTDAASTRMTESTSLQRLNRRAHRQGFKISTRQCPVRHYRLIEALTGKILIVTESLIEIESYLIASDATSAIYSDYYLRL